MTLVFVLRITLLALRESVAGFVLALGAAYLPFLCCAVLTASLAVQAQVSDAWQPVPKEDLLLKDNPVNPGSSAMILEREVYTDDEKRLQREWVRIKIFDEEGGKYGDVEIPYVARSTSIEDIRGRTVRQDGTVIEFQGTVFDNLVFKHKKLRYQAKTFTLPGVEAGAVVEYAYTMRWKQALPDYVRHPAAYLFTDGWTIPTATWTIQRELFTRHARLVFRPVKGGNLGWVTVRVTDNPPSTQPDGSVRMEVTNVAAVEEEDYMPPISTVNSRVHFYYRVGPLWDFWSGYGKISAKEAEKLINKTKFLEHVAREIAPPSDPADLRLHKLYTRVQQIRYISYEPSKTEKEMKRESLAENKSAEDILRHGYGFGNEINFLFTALARAAGFDASIVQVADRRTTFFEPTVLDGSQLTAIIVLVRLSDKLLYLDPASRFCPYGVVPWFETDTRGVLWDQRGGSVIAIPAQTSESAVIRRTAELKLQPDGAMEGKVEIGFDGQEALDRRLSAAETDEAGRRDLVEDEIKQWLPPGVSLTLDSVTGWELAEEPVRVKCHFYAAHFAAFTQHRMLFPPAIFQANRRAALTGWRRHQPVYFDHPYSEVDDITISLPAGYRLEALPEDVAANTKFAAFKATHLSADRKVHLERRADMNGYFFPPDAYSPLLRYSWQLRKSDADNVVLHLLEEAQGR